MPRLLRITFEKPNRQEPASPTETMPSPPTKEAVAEAYAEWRRTIQARVMNLLTVACGVYVALLIIGNYVFLQAQREKTIPDLRTTFHVPEPVKWDWTAGVDDSSAVAVVTTLVILSAAICVAVAASPRASTETDLRDRIAALGWGDHAARLGWWIAGISVGVACTQITANPGLGLLLLLASYGGALLAVITRNRGDLEGSGWLLDAGRARSEGRRRRLVGDGVPHLGRVGVAVRILFILLVVTVITLITSTLLTLYAFPELSWSMLRTTWLDLAIWFPLFAILVAFPLMPLFVLLSIRWFAWASSSKPGYLVSTGAMLLWSASWIAFELKAVPDTGQWGRLPVAVPVGVDSVVPLLAFLLVTLRPRLCGFGSHLFASATLRGINSHIRDLNGSSNLTGQVLGPRR